MSQEKNLQNMLEEFGGLLKNLNLLYLKEHKE